jgi:hypothetical protein
MVSSAAVTRPSRRTTVDQALTLRAWYSASIAELDWVCVTWDADLRFAGDRWSHHDFRGERWCNINSPDNRTYLQNAYRVLLTRARQGMVVFVPPGDPQDPTRSPDFYDSTFDYLRDLGIPTIE